MIKILKGGGNFGDDVNGGYLPEDLVLAVRDVKRSEDWVRSEGESTRLFRMQECKRCGHETVGPDLRWTRTSTVDPNSM